jgi:hypothetical protein
MAIITELLDQKKATYKKLSISESEFSYNYSTEDRKQSLMGIRATNDEAESVLCVGQQQTSRDMGVLAFLGLELLGI